MRNEGTVDRVIRVIVGIVLLYVGFVDKQWVTGTASIIIGIVGLIPLITGIVGFCPLYRVLGIRTCKVSEGESESL